MRDAARWVITIMGPTCSTPTASQPSKHRYIGQMVKLVTRFMSTARLFRARCIKQGSSVAIAITLTATSYVPKATVSARSAIKPQPTNGKSTIGINLLQLELNVSSATCQINCIWASTGA